MSTDPFDRAENAEWNRLSTFFGEVSIVDVWDCVLVKGTGKVLFDPQAHKPADLRTAIKIVVAAMPGRNGDITRDLIAESQEWAKITLPSLKALHQDLRGLKGRWVRIDLVPNGTYKDSGGNEKQRTAIKFAEVFADLDSCQAAADKFYRRDDGEAETTANIPEPPKDQAPATSAITNPRRQMAAKFLGPLWTASHGDVDSFAKMLRENKLTAEFFDLTSPEVVAAITG